jgi:hypothetical protein
MTNYSVLILNYPHDKGSWTRVARMACSPLQAARDRCELLRDDAQGLLRADTFPVLVTWDEGDEPRAELFELKRITTPRWEVD